MSCFKTPTSNFETPTHDFPYQGSGVFFAVQSYEVNKGLAGTNFLSSNHRLSDPTHSFQAICEQKETIEGKEKTNRFSSAVIFLKLTLGKNLLFRSSSEVVG